MSTVEVVHRLANIHKTATETKQEAGNVEGLVESRRRGVGCSTIGFTAPTRKEREIADGQVGTDKEAATSRLEAYVKSVIPFLYGSAMGGSNVRLNRKLCTDAICALLGVSRNFLYGKKKTTSTSIDPSNPSGGRMRSIIDSAGMRKREYRRIGERRGFPSIADMKIYQCGCDEPCFAGVPEWSLERRYQDFRKVSMGETPRRKERQFLLGKMFCSLSNSTVHQCDRSIAKRFTVSEGLVGAVRRTLHRMCTDPTLEDRPLRDVWWKSGYTSINHPANRMNDAVRERIENHLDMVLRPDPAGGHDISVCRVYSPEINTHEKLRKLLTTLLNSERDNEGSVRFSSSTLQRRINEYLEKRKLRLAYQQTDHNACPTCKTLKYASFQYYKECKHMEMKVAELVLENSEMASAAGEASRQEEIQALRVRIKDKKEQGEETVRNFNSHCARDRDIRKAIKYMSDHFRSVENKLIRKRLFAHPSPCWNSHKSHAIITHQDDMTKVDLPYFVECASADITRWRFDVNAHVSSVNGDEVVFSHEQGTGAKNAGCIVEEIILDHTIRCRGEAIKFIVSNNASVGKNWVTTIALPQYLVDQGLADIVLVVFLENNHGKWLADMLFGQLQTRRKRSTLLSIDDLLTEFESINRTTGTVEGFALNPLSSVDFAGVLSSLGYETKPAKDFNFTRRNIHFAGAAAPGVKEKLDGDSRKILGPALPDEAGLVRICCNPPGDKLQNAPPYEDRYFDVPAARLPPSGDPTTGNVGQPAGPGPSTPRGNTQETAQNSAQNAPSSTPPHVSNWHPGQPFRGAEGSDEGHEESDVPLVVPLDTPYSKSGNGVVASRTATHVGFNGMGFRKNAAFPELRNNASDIVRRAWPVGLVTRQWNEGQDDRLQYGSEFVKCAPGDWAVRRPVHRMYQHGEEIKARYPPRNLLNAQYKKGPRESYRWVPTRTYLEPPVPLI